MQAINHFKVLGSNGVLEKTTPDFIYFGHIGKYGIQSNKNMSPFIKEYFC